MNNQAIGTYMYLFNLLGLSWWDFDMWCELQKMKSLVYRRCSSFWCFSQLRCIIDWCLRWDPCIIIHNNLLRLLYFVHYLYLSYIKAPVEVREIILLGVCAQFDYNFRANCSYTNLLPFNVLWRLYIFFLLLHCLNLVNTFLFFVCRCKQ